MNVSTPPFAAPAYQLPKPPTFIIRICAPSKLAEGPGAEQLTSMKVEPPSGTNVPPLIVIVVVSGSTSVVAWVTAAPPPRSLPDPSRSSQNVVTVTGCPPEKTLKVGPTLSIVATKTQ